MYVFLVALFQPYTSPLQNLRISLDRSPKSIYVTHDKKRPFNVYIEESL